MSSRRRRVAVVGASALALALGTLFLVAALRRPEPPSVSLDGRPVSVTTSLSPRDPQFGDTVKATVDVLADTDRVDPDALLIKTSFAPYRTASTSTNVRHEGSISITRVETRLRCLELMCVPPGETKTFRFAPVRVIDRRGPGMALVTARWPTLRVHSRVAASDVRRPFVRVGQPRAAGAGYRLPPQPTGYALLGVGALLALGGAALLLRVGLSYLPTRRGDETKLERVLGELAAASTNGDSGRRRRALEQLARELEPLDRSLSEESRVLAWAPHDPQPDTIADLTARVRTVVQP